jgi:hypothetical protein
VLLCLSVGLLAVGLADLVSRLGRRLALRSAQRILARDARHEILFLRSFMDDRLTVRAHRTGRQSVLDRLTLRRFEQFEEILAWTMWRFGPVIALGDYWLPPLGAARISVPKGIDWESVVWNKLPLVQLIVMSAGRTKSVVDEVAMIRRAGALAKTIIVFPPVPEQELRQRLRFATQALELRRDLLQPAYLPGRRLLALTFDPAGKPVCVLGDARDDFSYQAAIALAITAVQAQQPTHVSAPAEVVLVPPQPNEQWLQPVAMPREARRKLARRRLRAIAPWIGIVVLQLANQILAVQPPMPPVPVPGHILSRVSAGGLTATSDGLLVTAEPVKINETRSF